MGRLNLFKRIKDLETRVSELEKESKTRGLKKRVNELELKLKDYEQGIEIIKKLESELNEALTFQRENANKYEQMEQELAQYFDFNK